MNLGQRRQLVFIVSGILLAAILVGGVFWLWTDEDEVVIRRHLDELVEEVNKEGDEAPFVLLMEMQEIMKRFAEEPEIDLGPPASRRLDREELQGFVLQARNNLSTIEVQLHEVEIEVGEERETAAMNLLASASVTYAGEARSEARRFHVDWVREDGDWVIRRVELIERYDVIE